MDSSRTTSVGLGTLLTVLLILPWMALSYLGNQLLGLPFPPYVLFDWLARVLPGDIITFGIDSIVALVDGLGIGQISETAKTIERITAVLILIGILSAVGAWISYRSKKRNKLTPETPLIWTVGLSAGMLIINAFLGFDPIGFLPVALWYLLLFAAWSYTLIWVFRLAPVALTDQPESPISRREFIYLLGGGVVTIGVGSLAVSRLLDGTAAAPETSSTLDLIDLEQTSGQAASPSAEELQARIDPAPGTRPELTETGEFYNVDINTLSPEVDGATWRLKFEGLVQNPSEFSLEDIRSLPSVSQVITLSCISNPIGGGLIGTALWTGVPFKHVLDEVGLEDDAIEILMEAEDGFYESISLEDALDPRTLLVYEMNGEPLPKEHGYPLRIYIPDRYGMKQPKWIIRMEAINREGEGYWVERGWSEEAYVRMTSVVDSAASGDTEAETIPIGGIAYAGAKGISKVEVQVDEGPWQEAELRFPPLSPLTWVQWRYDWPTESGNHTARVRAYDGSGELQIEEQGPRRPDGATGIHEYNFSV